jgi:hypothetical protein
MALQISATNPEHPALLLDLPWQIPLEEWPERHLVPLPRGISRHVVRYARAGTEVVAVKELAERPAVREFELLRDLDRLGIPAVDPLAVVTGRTDEDGEPLEPVLITRHLRGSMPYRSMFETTMRPATMHRLMDALAVLLVRLHLAGFSWGDCSLSNTLFRRDAGAYAAYLVDAETGELRPSLSDRLREHDLTIATENVFGELLDLQAGDPLGHEVDAVAVVGALADRYQALWRELTAEEEFSTAEIWRIEQRVERLNDLGFDVEELDIVTDWDGDRVVIQPRVVEAGHHSRELRRLTGLEVEDAQARRMLNDIAAYTAHLGLGREDRAVVANRWVAEVFEPAMGLIPPDARGKLEPAELFHELLVHRWYLSERAGHEVDMLTTARDYIAHQLPAKPEEQVTSSD